MNSESSKPSRFRLSETRITQNVSWAAVLLLFYLTDFAGGQTTRSSDPAAASSLAHILLEKIELDKVMEKNSINAMVQDRHGYMWLGTSYSGLVRYDGYQFDYFQHQPFDSLSLPDNNVRALYEDSRGWLWIGTDGGLACYRSELGRMDRLPFQGELPEDLEAVGIRSIQEDSTGALWLGTSDFRLYRMRVETLEETISDEQPERTPGSLQARWERILLDPTDQAHLINTVFSMLIDRKGVIWLVTAAGLGRLEEKMDGGRTASESSSVFNLHERIEPATMPDGSPAIDDYIGYLLEDHQGRLWGLADLHLLRIDHDKDSLKIRRYPLTAGPDYISLAEIPDASSSKIWISRRDEDLVIFDPLEETFRIFRPDERSFTELITIYQGSSGMVWLGGYVGVGLFKFDPLDARFANFHPDLSAIPFDPPQVMGIIYEDTRNNLWAAGNRGLFRCNRHTGEIQTILTGEPWNRVSTLVEDRNGRMWIGTEYLGLLHYDPQKQEVLRTHFPKSLENAIETYMHFTALHEDQRGHIWGAALKVTNNRINREISESDLYLYEFHPDSGKIQEHHIMCPESQTVSENRAYIYRIYPSSSVDFWLATGFGLFKYEVATGRLKHFLPDVGNTRDASLVWLHSIHPDPLLPDRFLWLGANGGGLQRFDQASGDFQFYTIKDGLPGNTVSHILTDDHGYLWLGTDAGLSRVSLHPESREPLAFQNFDHRHGILDANFSSFWGDDAQRNSNGEFLLTGDKGFTIFHPDSIVENPFPPQVMISELQIQNRPVSEQDPHSPLSQPIAFTEKLALTYSQNTLDFELLALHYRAPAENQYAYQMQGYDDDWIYNGTDRSVRYTGLPPGTYSFRLKAANSDGVWSAEKVALQITITPPWWRTWWAYLLYAFVFLTTLYGIRRYEMNRQRFKHLAELERVEASKLKELDSMKSRFFANISHEFRTPLTLILGQIDSTLPKISKEETQSKLKMAFRNAKQLLRLINQLLDLSKLEAGRLKLKAVKGDIIPFLKRLTHSFESAAQQKNISLRFEAVGTGGHSHQQIYFDPEKIEQVMHNLLSNALKFTPERGRVIVECGRRIADLKLKQEKSEIGNPKSEFVEIRVSDNGVGIPANRLPHIFDRFYQVDSSTTREHEGTGIGLALTKELVELHQGEISVTSEEGKGTTFTVRLPTGRAHLQPDQIAEPQIEGRESKIAEQTPSETPVELSDDAEIRKNLKDTLSSTAEVPGSSIKELLLIVEDNPDVRVYISQHLEGQYRILEAADGEEGLVRARETLPDLIISDVMMPKMDGYQFSREIRQDERTSHVPIIMLTAKAAEEDKLEGLQTGVDAYLIKPFSPKELQVRVKNLIALRKKLRERFSTATVIKPSEVSATPMDQLFLQRVLDTIEERMADEDFTINTLGRNVGMSPSQINRKLNALIDQSGGQLIRSLRLQRAASLLKQKAGNVTEICFEVGFNNLTTFNRSFKNQFGVSPQQYRTSK